jgi:hypothetical protein
MKLSLSAEVEDLMKELPISKELDKVEDGDGSINALGVIPNGKLVKKNNKDVSPIIKGESVMKQSRAAALLEKQYLLLDEATKFAFNPIMNIGGRLADVVASIEAELGKDALLKYTTDCVIVNGDVGKVKAILDKWKVQYTIETAESVIDGQDVEKMPDQVSTQIADPNMVNADPAEAPAEAPTIASMVIDCLKNNGFSVEAAEGGFAVSKDGASVNVSLA